jgi:hypothetical protein
MGHSRSQRHLREVRGYDSGGYRQPGFFPPPITATTPSTASATAAGAVNRTLTTLTALGGTQPYTWTVTSNGGTNVNILGNLLRANADPVGTVGVKNLALLCTDARGQTRALALALTLT